MKHVFTIAFDLGGVVSYLETELTPGIYLILHLYRCQ